MRPTDHPDRSLALARGLTPPLMPFVVSGREGSAKEVDRPAPCGAWCAPLG